MEAIKTTIKSMQDIICRLFYSLTNTSVMTYEFQKICSNKEDLKKYSDAVDKLKDPEIEEVTITLSTGETLTLI